MDGLYQEKQIVSFEDLSEQEQNLVKEFKTFLWSKIKPDMSNMHFIFSRGKISDIEIICDKYYYKSLRDIVLTFAFTNHIECPNNFLKFIESKNYFMPQIDVCEISEKMISLRSNT